MRSARSLFGRWTACFVAWSNWILCPETSTISSVLRVTMLNRA